MKPNKVTKPNAERFKQQSKIWNSQMFKPIPIKKTEPKWEKARPDTPSVNYPSAPPNTPATGVRKVNK